MATWYLRYISIIQVSDVQLGPLFCNKKGNAMSVAELDVHFHFALFEIQRMFSSVIPGSVKVKEEYSVYRLLLKSTIIVVLFIYYGI